jgi:hypothetical protein
LDRSAAVDTRTDAEVFFVVDTSRSMAAAAGHDAPSRVARAKRSALRIRRELAGVPSGIASLTDRALPHLFPTVEPGPFRVTLERSLGVERPPPGRAQIGRITDLGALAAVAEQDFFSERATKRLLVVLTDGETEAVGPVLGTVLRKHRIRMAFVHVRQPGESIFRTSAAEHEYRSDPASPRKLAQLAESVGGAFFAENQIAGAVAFARTELGQGRTRPRRQRDLLALMPWATLAAVFPLALVLRRRNL